MALKWGYQGVTSTNAFELGIDIGVLIASLSLDTQEQLYLHGNRLEGLAGVLAIQLQHLLHFKISWTSIL